MAATTRPTSLPFLLLLLLTFLLPSCSHARHNHSSPSASRSSDISLDPLAQQKADLVSRLPGQPDVSFNQYAGYVTVNESHGRAFFYWFIEAKDDPQNKPLLLWLNGGPGCSSVAYGASEEIGPFRINQTGASLYLNKYSWNRVANLLFLESPAGVGFSYTNTSSDFKAPGDTQTAEDNLIFMVRWMERFPQYKYREFYISGESYAGHYVPQLAKQIVDFNKKLPGHQEPFLNLRGFIVGNAVTDNYYDNLGTVMYWWSHAMISDTTYRSILRHCNFSVSNTSGACDNALGYAMSHEFGDIDQYSIYTPSCHATADDGSATYSPNSTNAAATTSRGYKDPRVPRLAGRTSLLPSLLDRRRRGYDPCTESYAEKYYNRPDVQSALHANVTGGIGYKWTACSDILIKNWADAQVSMLPTYRELISAGLRIWVFSGDTDSIVPVTATRFSIGHLHLPVKVPWYPWYSGPKQVGGWTEVYDGITFATVRGAGHEVPLFQPKRAFILFRHFLSGDLLPKK